MLDFEEIQREYAKCLLDKSRVYFIEHFLTTNNANERKITPFTLFPRQKVFCQSLGENQNTIAIKHRQAGITTVSAGYIAAQIVLSDKNSPETVLCVANQLNMASDMLGKIRDFLLQVPRWMWGDDDYFSIDENSDKNKKDIFTICNNKELKLFNGCRVVAKSSGENASRGVSAVSILIFDEAAFIENGTSVYSSAVAATSSVKNAKIIMVSTPNGKDDLYYKTYKQALNKENNYHAVEFKWFQDLRYNKNLRWNRTNENGEIETFIEPILDNSGTIFYDEAKWRNLEKNGWIPTSPWYESMCQSFNNNEMLIAQELDVSFVGSSNNVVKPEIIEMQNNTNVREPLSDLSDQLAPETWFWKPPIDGHRYICAVDPARGDGSDSTVIEIIDLDGIDDDGTPIVEQVLEYQGKRLGDDIGQMVYNYATVYNNAFVVIEAIGGVGDAAILTLMRLNYKNIYYDDDELKNYTNQNKLTQFKAQTNSERMPGFHSNKFRFQMLSNFASMLKNNEFKVRSIRMINELETWVYKNGRPDHMHGCHDDTITCTAMGLFIAMFSFSKLETLKNKNTAILNSYKNSRNISITSQVEFEKKKEEIKNKYAMPIYSKKTLNKINKPNGEYSWLFGG